MDLGVEKRPKVAPSVRAYRDPLDLPQGQIPTGRRFDKRSSCHLESQYGYRGWPECAPFDVILVAASPDHIPQHLVDQLVPGGRMVIPVGDVLQQLVVVEKQPNGTIRKRSAATVRFVPMTGEAHQGSGPPRPQSGRP